MSTTADLSDSRHKIAKLQEAFAALEALRADGKSLDVLRTYADFARRAEEYVLGFRQRLADIYQLPEPAFDRFVALVQQRGVEAAAADFLANPETYGTLKGWSIGPLNNAARNGILKLSVPAAARTAKEGFNAHAQTGGGGVSRDELKRKVEVAQDKMQTAETQFGSTGRRIELEMHIAELARGISFRDLAELPKEQYRVVETLRDKYRNLIQATENDPARRAAKKK